MINITDDNLRIVGQVFDFIEHVPHQWWKLSPQPGVLKVLDKSGLDPQEYIIVD